MTNLSRSTSSRQMPTAVTGLVLAGLRLKLHLIPPQMPLPMEPSGREAGVGLERWVAEREITAVQGSE